MARLLTQARVILLLMAFSSMLQGIVVEMSLEQLAQEAELVLVGRVESVKGLRRGRGIVSQATLRAHRVLKGQLDLEKPITVEFPGGQVGQESLRIEDSPDYRPGEEVVAFLKKLSGSIAYDTVGAFQGKLLIRKGMVERHNLPPEAFLRRLQIILQQQRKP